MFDGKETSSLRSILKQETIRSKETVAKFWKV